jgi:protein CpxP
MRQSLHQTLIAATAIVGFSAFAAVTAPAGVAAPATGTAPAAGQPATTARAAKAHNRVDAVDQRIADLHAGLQITPAQQTQWDQFAQVMRDNAKAMDDAFTARMKTMASMTAPQNMQSYAQVAMDHAQQVQKLVPPFQALYDTMSDNQKRLADQMFRADPSRPRRGNAGPG